jgi:hypothetical protein
MQADVGDNGPGMGDRLMDWVGAYNLFTHSHASYGGDNDVRQHSPDMVDFFQRLAFGTGAGTSLADVQNAASSAYREVAIVYQSDIKDNSGSAYPTTPGHFEQFAATTGLGWSSSRRGGRDAGGSAGSGQRRVGVGV